MVLWSVGEPEREEDGRVDRLSVATTEEYG